MADFQQELVYEWESDFHDFNRPTLTLDRCRKYIHDGCARYGVPPPRVRSHRKGGLTFYQACRPEGKTISAVYQVIRGSAVISFRADGRNPSIALHETAHAILNYWLPLGGYEDHGKEFCGIYFWLLLREDILPESALIASAKDVGINWLRNFTPGKFHRWRLKQQPKQILQLPV